MSNRVSIKITPAHLCKTCKYARKCLRLATVATSLQAVEANALENWKMDVDTDFMISECDRYSVDWNMVGVPQELDIDEGDEDE